MLQFTHKQTNEVPQMSVQFNPSTGMHQFTAPNGKVYASVNKSYVNAKYLTIYGSAPTQGASVPQETHAAKVQEFTVQEKFEFLEHFVVLAANAKINSVIITGSAGIGKTHDVMEILKREGHTFESYDDSHSATIMSGYSTAKGLYEFLYYNKDRVVVFDDLDEIHKDQKSQNVLKAVLNSTEKRVVSWNARFAEDSDVPNNFEFTGQIIFISNMPRESFPDALISRSFVVDLNLTVEEKIQRIEQIFAKTTPEKGDEVLTFLKNNKDKLKDCNVRMANNVVIIANNAIGDWSKLALYSLTV
jgi:hypothetical protein